MPTIEHKGTKLAYEEKGSGTPAFVFVHGWTCDRSFFAAQAEHFAQRHRVVSIDLRGHGESDAVSRANLYAALSTTSPGTQKSFVTRERFDSEWAIRGALRL